MPNSTVTTARAAQQTALVSRYVPPAWLGSLGAGAKQCPVIGGLVALMLVSAVVALYGTLLHAQGTESDLPTAEEIEERIAALAEIPDLDPAAQGKLTEAYQSAQKYLQEHESFQAALVADRALATSAPTRIKEIEAQLSDPPAPEPVEETLVVRLEAAVTSKQTEITALRAALERANGQLSVQQQRPDQLRTQLATARQRLARAQEELTNSQEVLSPTLSQEAQQLLLRARVAARRSEIAALEQETIVYEARLELFKGEQALVQRDLEAALASEAALEKSLSERRKEEAQKAAKDAKDAEDAAQALGVHPEVQRLLTEVAALIQLHSENTEAVEKLKKELRDVERRRTELAGEFAATQRKVDRIGLSGILGEILSEQRRTLRRKYGGQQTVVDRRGVLYETQAEEVRISDRLEALEQRQGSLIDEVMAKVEASDDISGRDDAGMVARAAEMAALRADVKDAIAKRFEALRSLRDTYGRYKRTLGNLEYQETELVGVYRRYSQFLNERLLWTPSTRALSPASLRSTLAETQTFLELGRWRQTLDVFEGGWRRGSIVISLALLFALVLVLLRRFWRFRLRSLGERVGKKYADGYYVTGGALLVTFALALPIPLFLTIAALVFQASRMSSNLSVAVVQALFTAAGGSFILLFTHEFCAKEGVAIVHFRWSERTATQFRRAARILLVIGVPLFAFSEVARGFPEAVPDTLERLAFIAGMILVTGFVVRLLSPNHGVLKEALQTPLGQRFYVLRYFWYPMLLLMPCTIALLSYFGYHYTARQFDYRLLQSLLFVVGGVIVYSLILRWLVIARRRLALARNLEKRESDSSEGIEGVEAEEVVDLATIKRQSQSTARISVIVGVALIVIAVWADVLPALSFFDFEVWKVVSSIAGETTLVSITLADVLLGLIVVIFAFFASRSLPGFLELSALRRLPIDPGNRYAVATIGQYLLVAVGVVAAFQLIGVGWEQVQWLVAALGVGLGFGLQEIFANFVSGLIILLERPMRVGDTVTVGAISGIVSRIRIRATTITDWDQKELVVPNKTFITGELINWTLTNNVTRIIVRVGVAYGSDTERTLELMAQAAAEHPSVLKDPAPGVFFVGFGSSSLDFDLRVFVKELSNRGRSGILHDLNMTIDQLFRDANITIAFPQLDVHFDAETPQRPGASEQTPTQS